MDRVPDGVRGGYGMHNSTQDLPETEYHGGAPTALLPDHGQRTKNRAQDSLHVLFPGATALFHTDHCPLPHCGMVDLPDTGSHISRHLRNEIPINENSIICTASISPQDSGTHCSSGNQHRDFRSKRKNIRVTPITNEFKLLFLWL
ncbi:hypothetical protein PSM36_1367 [Proteiniphilum saccharofermentans]|uniref:Uncharacterized protein n=1 Tax=Proteiniphilum saccharofermentans TaxID=1642647 RepID=A0A1R3T2E2_9BACT|nr:hypothetical protein PSM36_1367 [Proteiniphilum saccharofermentans]